MWVLPEIMTGTVAIPPGIFTIYSVQDKSVYFFDSAFAYLYIFLRYIFDIINSLAMIDSLRCSRIDLPDMVTPSFTTRGGFL